MKVAIRADASAAIGLGHVKRCLSLAQALRAQADEVARELRALDLMVQEANWQVDLVD